MKKKAKTDMDKLEALLFHIGDQLRIRETIRREARWYKKE